MSEKESSNEDMATASQHAKEQKTMDMVVHTDDTSKVGSTKQEKTEMECKQQSDPVGEVEFAPDELPSEGDDQTLIAAVSARSRESMPDEDTDEKQLIRFVQRQYWGYIWSAKKTGETQWRMGTILLRLRRMIKYGRWGAFIKDNFTFDRKTAGNWMRLASSVTLEEARSNSVTDLYMQHGIMTSNDQKDEEDELPETGDGNGQGRGRKEVEEMPDDDDLGKWKPLANLIKRLNEGAQKALKVADDLTPESYNSNDRHAVLLEDYATTVEGILRDLMRFVGRLYEVAAQAKATGHDETVANVKRIADKCAAFEKDLRGVPAEQTDDDQQRTDGRREVA